jgi:hypothetical protein
MSPGFIFQLPVIMGVRAIMQRVEVACCVLAGRDSNADPLKAVFATNASHEPANAPTAAKHAAFIMLRV